MMLRTVLVTGASGFVGKWTVIELLKAGAMVRGTVRSDGKAEAVRKAVTQQLGSDFLNQLDFVRLDIMHDRGWKEAMIGVDAVVHTAAQLLADEPQDPQEVIAPAVEGTERVMRFAVACGVRRIVLTSSTATVGYGHGHVSGKRTYTAADHTKLDAMRYTWANCIGKTKAERTAWAYARSENLELTTIHPGTILGPALDNDKSISLNLVGDMLKGAMSAMPRVGFSIVDVRDVAALHVAVLLHANSAGERYLAAADYLTFEDVADILRRKYPSKPIPSRVVPDWIMRAMALFGGSARQVINDVGNQKHYDRSKSELLLGHPFRSGREAVLATAESLMWQEDAARLQNSGSG